MLFSRILPCYINVYKDTKTARGVTLNVTPESSGERGGTQVTLAARKLG